MEFSDVIEFLDDIPAAFWGVVVGSFFSILGVWLTNIASTTRLQRQFEHERLVKTKERALALKKDIYLDAAEAMSLAIQTLAGLGNLDITNDKVMERYVEKSPAFANAQVVGSMELQNAMFEFTGEHTALILKLFKTRHKLMAEKQQIANLDAQVAEFRKEADRFVEMMKQYNIAGIQDQNKWNVLQSNHVFEHGRSVTAQKKRQDIAHELGLKHIKFIGECSCDAHALVPLIIPVLSAMREELEIPFEIENYKKIVQRSQDKQRKVMDDYLGQTLAGFSSGKE